MFVSNKHTFSPARASAGSYLERGKSPAAGVDIHSNPFKRFRKIRMTLNAADALRRRPESKSKTTLNNGYLGSRNDEERSEMRYLV